MHDCCGRVRSLCVAEHGVEASHVANGADAERQRCRVERGRQHLGRPTAEALVEHEQVSVYLSIQADNKGSLNGLISARDDTQQDGQILTLDRDRHEALVSIKRPGPSAVSNLAVLVSSLPHGGGR